MSWLLVYPCTLVSASIKPCGGILYCSLQYNLSGAFNLVPTVITPWFYSSNWTLLNISKIALIQKLLQNFCLECNCLSGNDFVSALNGCEYHSVRENDSTTYPASRTAYCSCSNKTAIYCGIIQTDQVHYKPPFSVQPTNNHVLKHFSNTTINLGC
jgi:hypothetical protein